MDKHAGMADTPESMYHCAPDIVWVKDSGHTTLVEAEKGGWWILRGEEAMVWDLLTLNYPLEEIVRFLSVMLETQADEAMGTVMAMLRGWEAAGILLPAVGDGRG